jgi:purine-cytosine permease-like protein
MFTSYWHAENIIPYSVIRDLAYLGAVITIVSVFFSAVTQNVLNTYTTTRDGRFNGLDAGRVPRSENFNRTNQPLWTGLNFRKWKSPGAGNSSILIIPRTTFLD